VGATTVKKHVSEILRKLKVHSRTQAVIEVSKLDQVELFDIEKRFMA
jgi:DNA-binding NarL/FixJ family response regulator